MWQWRKEWRTKENKGKHFGRKMMQALELQQWLKGTSWDEATLNNGEIKSIALAVIELCLSEGISQSVSQSDSQSAR